MTTTYTPDDPSYLDEADLRVELERVFDLCHGCRLCFNLCPSFPRMFDFVDSHDGDVSAMTPTRTRSSTSATSASSAIRSARTCPRTNGSSTSPA
jgi:ferredoxin